MGDDQQPRLRLVRDDAPDESDPRAGRDAPVTASPRSSPPGSFADAFRTHYDFVRRMLRVYGVESALVDDAAQDVFVVVHRRWFDYDGRRAFRSWLLGIVRKTASNYRRTGRRIRARLERLAPVTPAASLELRVEQREQLARIEAFVNTLGPRHRPVFVLAELEGLSAPEIAEALEIKLNTVYSRLRVARERFAAWWARETKRSEGTHG